MYLSKLERPEYKKESDGGKYKLEVGQGSRAVSDGRERPDSIQCR